MVKPAFRIPWAFILKMWLLHTLTTYLPAIGGAQLHQHLIAQQLKQKHQIQVISHWNKRRLGEIEFSIKQKIQSLSIAQLEILGENLIDFSNRQALLNYLENLG